MRNHNLTEDELLSLYGYIAGEHFNLVEAVAHYLMRLRYSTEESMVFTEAEHNAAVEKAYDDAEDLCQCDFIDRIKAQRESITNPIELSRGIDLIVCK